MGSSKRPVLQIVIAWRDRTWVLLANGSQRGSFLSKHEAMTAAEPLVEEAEAAGQDCHLIVQEKAGDWHDENCPEPPRPGA